MGELGQTGRTVINETKADANEKNEYKLEIVWRNVILMSLLHLGAIYGIKCVIADCQFRTLYFMILLSWCSAIGILCGSHRLWTHRSYKAKLPLQIILAIFQTMAVENDIYEWSRDHRTHHKFSETNADPHNAKRGFFFSHIGWLLCKKHPEVKEKDKVIDMSDLKKNPVVQFQRTFYIPLVILIWGVIPAITPYYCWNESLFNSLFTCVFFRYTFVLNVTWLVNSAAHMWGMKPYDKQINPVECIVRHLMMGEGFHNFHHTFAWDYSASEYGPSEVYNPATVVINICAKIGWAYDLKRVSQEMIEKKKAKYGDLSSTKPSPFKELLGGTLSSYSCYLILMILKVSYKLYNNQAINIFN